MEVREARLRELPKLLGLLLFRGVPAEIRAWREERRDRRTAQLPSRRAGWIPDEVPDDFG